jgi:hypothetical protein
VNQSKKDKILHLLEDISSMAKQVKKSVPSGVVNIANGVSSIVTSNVLYRYYNTNTEIPLPYLKWLSICDGISGACINTLYGIETINELLNLFPYWALKKWFPIAGDGCGDYYVVVPTNINNKIHYPVIFLDHEHPLSVDVCDQVTCIVSSDFELFLIFFLEEILFTIDIMLVKGYADNFEEEIPSFWWPFDRETVIEKDPDIMLFNLPLPWEV